MASKQQTIYNYTKVFVHQPRFVIFGWALVTSIVVTCLVSDSLVLQQARNYVIAKAKQGVNPFGSQWASGHVPDYQQLAQADSNKVTINSSEAQSQELSKSETASVSGGTALHLRDIEGKYQRKRWRRYQNQLDFQLPRIPGQRQPTNADCCLNDQQLANNLPGHGPDAFIAGVQKGGTSWLHEVLSSLGGVQGFRCDVDFPDGQRMHRSVKEVHFFDHLPVKQAWVDDYLKGFPPSANGSIRLDSTPATSRVSFAPCRIKMMFPKAKIVLLLREPAERMFSGWLMTYGKLGKFTRQPLHVVRGDLRILTENRCTFGMNSIAAVSPKPTLQGALSSHGRQQQASATTNARQKPKSWRDCFGCEVGVVHNTGCFPPRGFTEDDLPPDWEYFVAPYIPRSMYAPMLAWWLEYFPPEQILIINSQSMKDSPAVVANRIASFLGIKHEFAHEELFQNGKPIDFVPSQHSNWSIPGDDIMRQLEHAKQQVQHVLEPLTKQLYLLLEYYGYSFPEFRFD